MKLEAQKTSIDDVNAQAWAAEAERKQQLLRVIVVNNTTGEALEFRQVNAQFIASASRSAITVDSVS